MLSLKFISFVTFLTIALVAAQKPVGAQDKEPRPLSEAELLQLSNLLGKAEALLARLEKAGVEKSVDAAALERLKKAGVPDTVLAAVRRAFQPAAARAPVTLYPDVKTVTQVALSPDGKTVALGGDGERVELWDAATGKLRAILEGLPGRVTALAFAPDGKTLAAACYKQVKLWEAGSGKEVRTLRGHTDHVLGVQFFPDGKSLVSATRSEARVWAPDPEPIDFAGNHWALTPDGNALVSYRFALSGGSLTLWDAVARKKRKVVGLGLCDSLGTARLAVSADSRTVVVGQDEQVMAFDLTTTAKFGAHGLHSKYVTAVDVSPDGKVLASGGRDRAVILWDVVGQKERMAWGGHKGPVFVRFSPDGKLLASGSDADDTVKLWDVAMGKERGTLQGHKGGITALGFSADGKTAATASKDGTVKLWNLSPFAGAGK